MAHEKRGVVEPGRTPEERSVVDTAKQAASKAASSAHPQDDKTETPREAAMMRRYSEAMAEERILPFRVIPPDQRGGSSNR